MSYPIAFRSWIPSLLIFLSWLPHSLALDGFHDFISSYCTDCHSGNDPEGGLDLSLFVDTDSVMADRTVWNRVYQKLESREMPPPKQDPQPSEKQRLDMLGQIELIAARPDPRLGGIDPGKPPLRRLTRLEYNNSIRDLFELDMDIFMFPERLPLVNKRYFQPAVGKMPSALDVNLRENGAKYPVLCPNLGLPGDNRAEHGFRNRGDAMDFSPMLFEKYVAAAMEIAYSPELPRHSPIAAQLLGIASKERSPLQPKVPNEQDPRREHAASLSGKDFGPNLRIPPDVKTHDPKLWERFRSSMSAALANSVACIFDADDETGLASIVKGKGDLAYVRFAEGRKRFTINPDSDIWLVSFRSAKAASGKKLFCNHSKGKKTFELTFRILDGDENEGIEQLAICVLGRRMESGIVKLVARQSDGTEQLLEVDMPPGSEGSRVAFFQASPGETIRSLYIDGRGFSGDYVLFDDLAIVTNGRHSSTINRNSKADESINHRLEPARPSESKRLDAVGGALKASDTKPSEEKTPPRTRLLQFIRRAFRKPVSEIEAQPFLQVYDSSIQSGATEAESLRQAMVAILSSSQFLFVEVTGDPHDGLIRELTDHELAMRLSLFLWSSLPDEHLTSLANNNKLSSPDALESEVRRMLRDPKSRELSESFCVQWLRLDQLYSAKPDREQFKTFYSGPQGKSTLHGVLLVEALLLFETVHVEDRSILDFIAADYTWLNPSLAKHYGIDLSMPAESSRVENTSTRELKESPAPSKWTRFSMADTKRGGFITMGAPLVVTSLPLRTSLVKRGAWLLESIFNRPPTEPKVAFSIDSELKEITNGMSVRQKFELHRSSEACLSCHVRLDPPGFALERFDPVGRWREKDGDQPIDAQGEWQGKAFDGPEAFKQILLSDSSEFTRGYIEHLLSYAIGRKLEIYDMPAVKRIQEAARADHWRFSRIVVEIAKSYPFTHIRNDLSDSRVGK